MHGVNKTYDYDANGNLVRAHGASGTRTVTWTSFNKPVRITNGSSFSAFAYGPDRMRYKQVRYGPDAADPAKHVTTTTWTVGNLYEQIDHGTRTTHRYNIRVGSQVIAVKEHETAKADAAGALLKHQHFKYPLLNQSITKNSPFIYSRTPIPQHKNTAQKKKADTWSTSLFSNRHFPTPALHSDWRLDVRMMFIPDDFEILEAVIEDRIRLARDLQLRQRQRFA